jgi:euchromatic histone-lysine N-methyltransferase
MLLPDFDTHGEVDYPRPSVLIAAPYMDSVPMARLLLEKGAVFDYSPKYYSPESPRFSAMPVARSAEMVQLLLDFGADARNTDAQMNTLLHHAARAGNMDMVKLLVDQWPKGVRAENRDWETPLHLAGRSGRMEVMRLLLECWPEGARAKDVKLFTPLHWAAASGMIEVVRFLLQFWPEGLRAKGEAVDTPLHLAATR